MDMSLVNSGSWWWTGRPGMLRFMGSQRVGHDWVTEINWTKLIKYFLEQQCALLWFYTWYTLLLLFCHPVRSDSLWLRGLQPVRPLCPSPSPEFAQVHVHCIVDAMQPSHPLMPSIFPSIRDFSNESAVHIRWPKYWSFIFSINPSNEYLGLIYLRLTGLILLFEELSWVLSSTIVWRHQFYGTLPSLWFSS